MSRATPPVAVLGAGLAGLTAANALVRRGHEVVVFERTDHVAGLAGSRHDDQYVRDVGAHFMTNRLAAAVGISARCLPAAEYGESVLLEDGIRRYPTGLLRNRRYLTSALRSRVSPPRIVNAADRFRAEYGDALADEVAIPLVEAWSGRSAQTLAPSVADKIPAGLAHTHRLRVAGRLAHRAVSIGYCASAPEVAGVHLVYPESGGIDAVCEALAEPLRDQIVLNADVEQVHVVGGRAVAVRIDGHDREVAAVVSSLPIGALARLTDASTTALQPCRQLTFRGLVIVELRVAGRPVMPDVVNWFPDAGTDFFRVTEVTRAMPWIAPGDTGVLVVDHGAQPGDALWNCADDVVVSRAIDGLERWVTDLRSTVLHAHVQRVPLGYPVFALEHEPVRRALEAGTGIAGLVTVGRNGEFGHWLMEDVYWRTIERVDACSRWLRQASESATFEHEHP